jgi:hypothetical protein
MLDRAAKAAREAAAKAFDASSVGLTQSNSNPLFEITKEHQYLHTREDFQDTLVRYYVLYLW